MIKAKNSTEIFLISIRNVIFLMLVLVFNILDAQVYISSGAVIVSVEAISSSKDSIAIKNKINDLIDESSIHISKDTYLYGWDVQYQESQNLFLEKKQSDDFNGKSKSKIHLSKNKEVINTNRIRSNFHKFSFFSSDNQTRFSSSISKKNIGIQINPFQIKSIVKKSLQINSIYVLIKNATENYLTKDYLFDSLFFNFSRPPPMLV